MKSKHLFLILASMLTVLFALPLFAQSSANQAAPDLRGTFPELPPTPVPVDENGNPILAEKPTEEQLEAQRVEQETIAQNREAEEQRVAMLTLQAEETARQFALMQEHEKEQERFHDRLMWAIYIGLAIAAVYVGSRVLRKKD